MKQSFQDFEIIFIDNNSSDGSIEFARNNFNSNKIKIYNTGKNLGFAGGNNFGLKYCSGEYMVLLNNDTIVDKDWLKNLLECISADEQIGIAQSLVITDGIPMKYYEKNGTINILGHNIMEVFDINKTGIGEIFQANGCSLAIRKKLVDSIGGLFPDEYFAYSEDTFLCFKVKFEGLRILHTSKSIVYHKGGGTSKKNKSSFLFFYQERNRLLNFFIFFPSSFMIKYIPFLAFNFFMKLTISPFSKKYSAIQLIKAYSWLLTSNKFIRKERIYLNSLKKVNDDNVLKYISGKIFNGNNIFEKIVNMLSIFYCKLSGIKVMENQN